MTRRVAAPECRAGSTAAADGRCISFVVFGGTASGLGLLLL